MKIVVVAPEFPPDTGGMQRYAEAVAVELARRGSYVRILTRKSNQVHAQREGLEVVPCLVGDWTMDRTQLASCRNDGDVWHVMNSAWLWVALEVAKPIVLTAHGNDFLNPNPVATMNLRTRLRLPWGSRMDLWIAHRRTNWLVRQGTRVVNQVLANSRFTAAVFLEFFPWCRGRTVVSPLGVDAERFSRVERGQRHVPPKRLLTVSRLSEPRKNIDVVLHALARLTQQFDFQYTIVGDGTLRPSLERLARALGLSDRVLFRGEVDDSMLADCYAASDLFVLTPSRTKKSVEGFGLVYLEANASGVPVLAARTGGVEDAVHDGLSGLLLDQVTVEAVEEGLRRFMSGDVQLSSESCRIFARSFTWGRAVDKVVEAYDAAIDEGPRGRAA